jgi:predicted metal-dependent hydrolase
MTGILQIGGMDVDLIRKDIKNLHLSVHPPTGRIRIAAPIDVNVDAIRAFAISRLAWIRRHQRKLVMQEREPPRIYVDRESHFVWGDRVMLQVVETDGAPSVILNHRTLVLSARPGLAQKSREAVVDAWYRDEVRLAATPLIEKWSRALAVSPNLIFVQSMKTKWGSCNPANGNIRLNTELAKKPVECLDYIVLHELAHLREPTHSAAYFELLDGLLPHWRDTKALLNSLPTTF